MGLVTALMFQDRNFVGREYFAALDAAGKRPDLVVAVGQMRDESIIRERARTGGLWEPPSIPDNVTVHRFDRLDDHNLLSLLFERDIDIAIQAGIGILKSPLLDAPRLGFLNVHPGRLPQYRGNNCPEWAIRNGDPVVATAHLIDIGIDTGPVICAAPYHPAIKGYAGFRAGLYTHCAEVLIEALSRLERGGLVAATTQDETGAHYWPPISKAEMTVVRERLA